MNDLLSRRDFVKAAALAAAAAALSDVLAAPAVAEPVPPAVARGTVFDDADGSRKFTAGKKGIAGVLISNGRDVVRTDAQGRYTIPLPDNSTLLVIKPRDWMTPVPGANLPLFYYHHFPTGTPQWRPDPKTSPKEAFDPSWYYPGIAPSGPLPATIDFPLVRRPEPDRFRVLVFGDPQPGTDEQLDWMGQTVIQELIGRVQDVAFGITLGDVVNVGRLQYFGPVNRFVSQLGLPWYNVVGNHDQNLIVPNDSLSSVTFASVFGPTTYAFDYGPVSFVVLKNIIRSPFSGFEHPDDSNGGYRPKGDEYTVGLQPDQWEFLKNYLATVPQDRPLVLCMHGPLGTEKVDKAPPDERRLLEMLSGRPHTLSMSGHTHVQAHYFLGKDRGFAGPGEHHHFNSICVRGAGYRGPLDETQIPSCMASDGCEQGYSFITFDGNKYDIEYKAARRPADRQMNLFIPALVAKGSASPTPVIANIFAGSDRSTVDLIVNNGIPVRLKRVHEPDPAMSKTLELEYGKAPWTGPKYKEKHAKISQHVWRGELPGDLPVGTHLAAVRTTDMFGKTYVAHRSFRVVDHLPTTSPAGDAEAGA